MIRQHKKMILLTSIATLLPILIGLLLWKQLPDSVATHWSAGNEPDGYSSKVFAVFGLPVTGVVDFPTWYKISDIYVAVSRIAELR